MTYLLVAHTVVLVALLVLVIRQTRRLQVVLALLGAQGQSLASLDARIASDDAVRQARQALVAAAGGGRALLRQRLETIQQRRAQRAKVTT